MSQSSDTNEKYEVWNSGLHINIKVGNEKLENEKNRYMAQFVYNGVYYYLSGVMAQSDFHREDKLNKLCETKQRVQEIVEANESFTLKDMNINGRDLINMGISEGKMIGNILNELFEDILENPAHNNREYLREKAEKIFSKNIRCGHSSRRVCFGS